MPAALAARPEIAPWAEPYWRAFLDLARERPPGPPPGPIPLSAVREWLAEERIDDPGLRAEFREIVGLLDQAWIAHVTTADATAKESDPS
ncbi:hypothetical protein STVA_40420 [Allostella vacuolata]|nr:hypothetical protein STVA_40420 [Stella vacuolata]